MARAACVLERSLLSLYPRAVDDIASGAKSARAAPPPPPGRFCIVAACEGTTSLVARSGAGAQTVGMWIAGGTMLFWHTSWHTKFELSSKVLAG